MKIITAAVRGTLAHHTGRSVHAIHAWHRLEADLDLTPLEIVIIGMELEEIVGSEIPVDALGDLETVADLFGLVSRVVAADRTEHAIARVA